MNKKIFLVFLGLFLIFGFWAIMPFTNIANAQTIQVTAPNGGECLTAGNAYAVSWSMSGVDHADVYYSNTGNEANKTSIIHAVPGQTAYAFFIPSIDTSTGKIFIYGHNASEAILASDSSDGYYYVMMNCGSQSNQTPTSPSGLSATVASNGVDVNLSWTDNSSNETSFEIYARVSSGNWYFVSSVNSNIISYTNTGLSSGTYEYNVSACNSYGCSGGSNYSSVTIGGGGASGSGGGGSGSGTSSGSTSGSYAQVSGKVTDSTGAIVSGASINIFTSDYSSSYGESTDNQGTYVIYGIPAGTYKIKVNPPYDRTDFISSDPVDITLSSGQTLTNDLVLVKAAKSVKGTVKHSDGSPITDAYVNAWQKATDRHLGAPVDSQGKYAFGVTGGTWEVSVSPNNNTSDWSYNQPPYTIIFADNSTIEEKILDFVVSKADAAVKGKFVLPDGTIPPNNSVYINFQNISGYGTSGSNDSYGSFLVKLQSGSYSVYINVNDQTYSAPGIAPITIVSGETKDLGTIALVKATKTIKGAVIRSDGSKVAGAEISAWQKDAQKNAWTKTDSSGNYILLVIGGSWEVSVYGDPATVDWTYNQPPQQVTFASDTAAEEKIINFAVTTADALVKGKILLPDGTPPPSSSVNISFQGSSGASFGTSIDSTGSFSAKLSQGTYSIYIHINNLQYNAPAVAPLTLADKETKDLGVIYLVKAAKTIKGSVKRADGKAVTDAYVNAWKKDSQSNVQAQTDSQGNYTLLVTGGYWEVSIYPVSPTSNWGYNQPPKTALFQENTSVETATVNFTVVTVDASVKGKIVRPDGTVPSPNTVFLDFRKSDGTGFGTSLDSNGTFSLKLTAGTYNVFMNVMDPGFTAPVIPSVTITSGETKDMGTITLVKAAKTIKGSVKRADGKPVTDAYVNAWKKETSTQTTGSVSEPQFVQSQNVQAQTDSEGNYTLLVTGGYWEVSTYPVSQTSDWTYNQPPQTVLFSDDASAEEKIVNFSVTTVDAVVKGIILRPDGTAPASKTVFIDFRQAGQSSFDKMIQSVGGPVESNGSFLIKIPSGTYDVFIHVEDPGFSAPVIPSITIASGETKDLGTIKLIKATKTVKGSVKRADGKPVTDAHINAWKKDSQAGANIQTQTDSQGNFTMLVTGGFWEVGIYPVSKTADWTYNQPPQTALFADDATSEEKIINFTALTADSAITGKVLRSDAKPMPVDTVFVELRKSDGSFGFGSPVDANGLFRVSVPAGSFAVSVWSHDQTYAAPPLAGIIVASGETKDIGTITLVRATKVIRGTVTRSDGRVVTDAEVGAYRKETQSWTGSKVDSSGNYSLILLGGTWEISLHPFSSLADWVYNKSPEIVSFAPDSSAEEKITNFTVTSADATIKGKILNPDGTPPLSQVFVGLKGSEGEGFGGPIDSTGAFQAKIVSGIYNIFIHSEAPSLTAPSLPAITVASGETKDVGEIRLVIKKDHIAGRVSGKDEKGLGNILVEAHQSDGFGFSQTLTKSDGTYVLLVTSGAWEVFARPDPSTNFYNPAPPQRVNVVSGATSTVNFTLLLADSGITGVIVDGSGNQLFDVYGYAGLSKFTESGSGIGGPIDRGAFSFSAPSGTSSLSVFMPPDSPYTPGSPQNILLVSGKTLNVKVVVKKNTSKITGFLKDETGKPITGYWGRVFATSKTGIWQETQVDKATGAYSLNIAAGTWYLGYEIDPASLFSSSQQPTFQVTAATNETVTKDLAARKAGSIISGRVINPSGQGVSHAFVGAGNTSFGGFLENLSEEFKDPFTAGGKTDAEGFYKFVVPAGTYFVKTFVQPELGFINADEQKIAVLDGKTATVNFQLRKSDVSITGKTFIGENPVGDAFIWGWSEKGGYQESFSQSDGSFRLNVTSSSTWRIASAKEFNGDFYKSGEISVKVGSTSVTKNISLSRIATLAPTTLQTSAASVPAVVTVSGGPTVVAPANSIATGGSVSISITPDTRVASQGEVKVVGVAYDFEARDETGIVISSFNTAVTVSIPYEEGDLAALGIKEEALQISFWDETAAVWKTIDSSVVNKEDNIVTITTDHFTRFAIVAAADITPPDAPSNVKISASGEGRVKISWTNPAKDFHHVKIYRSEKDGESGTVVLNDISGASTTDSGLTGGKTYYYLLRSIDPAGNESNNTEQIKIALAGILAKPQVKEGAEKLPPGIAVKLQILRNLSAGSQGDDVKAIQELLLKEGVYPEGLVTGFFGNLTKQAVIRFQEKYADEILKPAGLENGTGFVGPSTIKKINKLLGGVEITASLPPGQAIKLEILRNLTAGNSGDDIKSLQELLLKEGVYQEGLITGFFGNLTKQAVIRFQEKYADEILAPNGLTSGTGFVGPSTRAKINQLLK